MKKRTTEQLLAEIEEMVHRTEMKADNIEYKLDLIRPRFRVKIEAKHILTASTVILTACAVWWTVFDIYFRH